MSIKIGFIIQTFRDQSKSITHISQCIFGRWHPVSWQSPSCIIANYVHTVFHFFKLNQNNSFYNTQINVGWLDDWLVVFYAPSTARSSLPRFYRVSTANRTPGSSLHYRCDTPAPLRLMLYLKLLHMHFINKFD